MKYCLFIMILFFTACNNAPDNNTSQQENVQTINKGEELFTSNCAVCHKLDADFIGPTLKNAASRWKNKELLYDFIKNSADVIPRNEYAKKLFEKYKQSPMPAFPQLKDEDIKNILQYCEKEEH